MHPISASACVSCFSQARQPVSPQVKSASKTGGHRMGSSIVSAAPHRNAKTPAGRDRAFAETSTGDGVLSTPSRLISAAGLGAGSRALCCSGSSDADVRRHLGAARRQGRWGRGWRRGQLDDLRLLHRGWRRWRAALLAAAAAAADVGEEIERDRFQGRNRRAGGVLHEPGFCSGCATWVRLSCRGVGDATGPTVRNLRAASWVILGS